jgi:hypothetical protein
MRSIPARLATGIAGVAVTVIAPMFADHTTPPHGWGLLAIASVLGLVAVIASVIPDAD